MRDLQDHNRYIRFTHRLDHYRFRIGRPAGRFEGSLSSSIIPFENCHPKSGTISQQIPAPQTSSCEVKKPTARANIVIPSSLSRCHQSRVITATQYDPRDGTWLYSTNDKAVHNRTKAKSALLQNWNSFQHYCCKMTRCELCHEHQRSRRAGLVLDVIKTQPKSGRSNKKKFHQILKNILSST